MLCCKNNKNICQNQYIKNTSSNEIKNIPIQYQRHVIVKDILFLFKSLQQQFNLMPNPLMNLFLLFNNQLSLKCSIRCNFLLKHSGQKLIFLQPIFSTIDHLISDVI